MGNKKYIGIFHSIDTVLYKITELMEGYEGGEIYVVTIAEDTISMLRGQTNVKLLDAANENGLQQTKLIWGDKGPLLDAFERMGFSEQQSRDYYDLVKNGGILLFVEDKSDIQGNQSNERHRDSGVLDEMDSSGERGLSGEQLDGQDEYQQIVDNDGTVPRLNTDNL